MRGGYSSPGQGHQAHPHEDMVQTWVISYMMWFLQITSPNRERSVVTRRGSSSYKLNLKKK